MCCWDREVFPAPAKKSVFAELLELQLLEGIMRTAEKLNFKVELSDIKGLFQPELFYD